MPHDKKDALRNTMLVQNFRRSVDSCNLNHVPQSVRKLLAAEAWRERYEMMHYFKFDDFVEFITGDKRKGACGWAIEKVTTLLEKAGDEEALELWLVAIRARKAQEIEAKDKANLRPAHRPTKESVSNAENDGNTYRPVGNTAAYALRKLRADRPDIHARVLAGEITPHAGMVEAGFRKKPTRKQTTTFERVLKLLPGLSGVEWHQIKQQEDRRRDLKTPPALDRRKRKGAERAS